MGSASVDVKKTVNLPRTDFPMKANLAQMEPKTLLRWETEDLYAKIRAARAGSPMYVLHDGPPYANGNIHLGHALNKILKDFVVKLKTMEGLRFALRPRLGLPRPAHRDQSRQRTGPAQSPDDHRADPRRVPQVRRQVRRSRSARISSASASSANGRIRI